MTTPRIANGDRRIFGRTFLTLRYRDFRLFWIALSVSLVGVSFQTVAQGWLVYRLTDSELMLGLTGFIPAMLAAPASLIGGFIADRMSRRTVVIATQSLMAIPPLLLSYLIWRGLVQPWHVIAATAVLGILAAVDLPSRTAMVPQLVPQEDLLNAQGLTSAVGQVSRIVGPAVAGLVIAQWGEALPYLINSLTYLAMVAALVMMRPQPPAATEHSGGSRRWMLAGVRYVLASSLVLGLFAIAAAQGLLLNSYIVLLPVFARDILQVGPEGLGWLSAAIGVGALGGALMVASIRAGRRGKILLVVSVLMPFALASFGWSNVLALSLLLLLLLGFGTVLIRTITATFILTIVPDGVRGRVLSLATLVYYGAPYAGGLPVTFFAERIPIPVVISFVSFIFLGSMIAVNMRVPSIRAQE